MRLNFHDPGDLMEQTMREIRVIPTGRIFRDGAYQRLQDQWGAATFGFGYGKYVRPCQVAVNESRYRKDADFFLQAGGSEFPFQFTERQSEGRKRADEYKEIARLEEKIAREPERSGELLSELLSPYRPVHGGEIGPDLIEQAIAKKVKKYYAKSRELNLLVYANFTAMGMEVDTIRETAGKHSDAFASIWIITDSAICSLYSNDQLGHIPEGKWGIL